VTTSTEPQERDNDFADLMRGVKEGDQQAARLLFERYGPHVLRVVRRRLNSRLRSRFDSIDFVQDVWTSFFLNEARRCQFDQPESLIRFLANMAYHKVVDGFRHQLVAQKNNLTLEHSFESSTCDQGRNLVGAEPTPSRYASAREEWSRLLRGKPAVQRGVVVLLAQGDSHKEIARKLGITVRTVTRIIRRLNPGAGS
jgi:RNA polymerase sigma-70 factor (ECF subfamily)